MSRQEHSVEVLNDLVKINNDRIVGYERAMSEAKDEDSDLKSTFSQMAQESKRYKQELSEKVRQLGSDPETGTRTDGKIYRMWMDVKAMFTGSSRKAVLENCEFGEDAAQRAYEAALNDDELDPELRQVVARQQQSLRQSHDTIKRMRDTE
jgi:uncharacterized protein (TIGR02284 family)